MFNNLLKTALTSVPRQRVDFVAYTGRTADDLGRWVASYAQPVDAFGSFQPMGTKEAKENGFEVAGRYAKFLTDADIKPVRRDGAPDKIVYDGVTYDVIGVDNWFAQDGWKRVYLVEGDAVAVVPPTPSCTITLTGDAAALIPNGAAMTIVGQTASYTRTDDTTNWIATTNPAVPYMPPASSTAIVEIAITQAGLAITEARITTMDLQSFAEVGKVPSLPGKWGIGVRVNDSPDYVNFSVDDTAIIALGVDATGSPAIFVDGSPLDLGGAGSGVFSSGFGLMAYDGDNPGGTSGSGSVTFRTAGDDFTQTYPAGTKDWCGNEL